jgi:hypothetical protein
VQFKAPTEADLDAFFAAFEASGSRKTLVHCAANWRVSAFVGLHRVLREGVPREAAFAQLYELWEPDEVWSAFIDEALTSRSSRP